MTHYPYLIIGAGMTAAAAARGIREIDTTSSIGMIGAESDRPYKRPPLSKGLWNGEPLDSIWCELPDAGVDLHLGRRVVSLDPRQKQATDDRGSVYRFDTCLLATGGASRRLSVGDDQIISFRTLDDYRRLRELTEQRRRFAVIGGGFIGSEIAAALAMRGVNVTLLFPQPSIGHCDFPPTFPASFWTITARRGSTSGPTNGSPGLSDTGARRSSKRAVKAATRTN